MDAKTAARERLESARDGLINLSHRIHAHREPAFEEEQASTWLCESLADPPHDRHQLIARLQPPAGIYRHCVTPDADQALVDGALAMAWTCVDLAMSPDARKRLMAPRR